MIEYGVAIGCNHSFLADRKACKMLWEAIADMKPVHRVHLGDNWDLSAIRTRATEKEQSLGIGKDIDCGEEFLDCFRPTAFCVGNHEQRVYNLRANRTGIVHEHAVSCINDMESMIRKHTAKILPRHIKKGIYRLAGISFMHGFSCGVNSVRDHAAWFGDCIIAHIHRTEMKYARRIDRPCCFSSGGCHNDNKLSYIHDKPAMLEWRHSAVGFSIDNKTGRTQRWHILLNG